MASCPRTGSKPGKSREGPRPTPSSTTSCTNTA
jgi:hypothetical protein